LGTAWTYLSTLARGDFGRSRMYGRPVSELLSERALVTLRSAATALALGWAAAMVAAVWVVAFRSGAVQGVAMTAAALVICVPTVLAGFLTAVWQVPVETALTAIVFARAYTYSQRILLRIASEPHVLLARATGSRLHRIVLLQVLRNALPQLLAVAANSVVLVLGASVPIEVVRDIPGLGQLAWKATMARDLPVLLAVTLVVSVCSVAAAAVSDGRSLNPGSAPA
jgi:peptide/nickel transport system permease protein